MVVLLALEYLHVPSRDLHSSDMAGLLLPLLPEQGSQRISKTAGEGQAPRAAGAAPRPAQAQEPDGGKLRHGGQGLGGGTHLGPDHDGQNPGEWLSVLAVPAWWSLWRVGGGGGRLCAGLFKVLTTDPRFIQPGLLYTHSCITDAYTSLKESMANEQCYVVLDQGNVLESTRIRCLMFHCYANSVSPFSSLT